MKIKAPLLIEIIFIFIAFLIYFITGNDFYIYNFLYIGTSLAIGIALLSNGYKWGRNLILLAIGCYMLIFLGLIGYENMLMSGFWYYLFLGVFEAAVIHFLVAKIAGPFLFGRGWCGYACWTAMVLDLLPYKVPQNPRKNFGYIRYILFVVILCFVSSLFVLKVNNLELIMYYTFIVGNIIYYAVGIVLAFVLKDNRAFCKYICIISFEKTNNTPDKSINVTMNYKNYTEKINIIYAQSAGAKDNLLKYYEDLAKNDTNITVKSFNNTTILHFKGDNLIGEDNYHDMAISGDNTKYILLQCDNETLMNSMAGSIKFN